MSQDSNNIWKSYYKAVEGRKARLLFVSALSKIGEISSKEPPFAIDLGCGDGTETLVLLKRGWKVLAIDGEPDAIELLETKVPDEHRDRLQTSVTSFQRLKLPPADLVYAGLSLPFCPPSHFEAMWQQIVNSVRAGGRFAGHLFGVNDSWATNPDWTFHDAETISRLLEPFEIEIFDEIEDDGSSTEGPKHWHLYNIIARKAE